MRNEFDCIVIGGGHAGIEAAHAAAKIGVKTCLMTIRKDKIGEMSCNPAVGGLAKGQIVREIDALGGLMGLATDATGIQFKILNSSKGPAVQSPRAQADRFQYQKWMEHRLEQTENLTIIETMAKEIIADGDKVQAVIGANGQRYQTKTVVVTTGTFLDAMLFCGDEKWPGGRIGEPPSIGLSDSLRKLGLTLGRMATDTTPRLDAKTIDYDKTEATYGDEPPVPFSFITEELTQKQVPCWQTYTHEKIHQLLRDNLHRAPLSAGQITGTDPRYCPSIEGKIVTYKDKERHRIILEPEEATIETIYVNGVFTSMPKDVQEDLLKMMPGTENARIKQYAYAVEYDYCPAIQLKPSLETKKISGLFTAGQINGTSGYEEAAGQGIVAGINAALKAQNCEPVILRRDQAYIGVLIDDLLTKDIKEPYRMFTSRAEYRLTLRSDNADRRLTEVGRAAGLVDDHRWEKFENKIAAIAELKNYLKGKRADGLSLWEKLRQPENTVMESLADDPELQESWRKREVTEAVAIDAKYEGYMNRQNRLVANSAALDKKKIPVNLDYHQVIHLRREAREKLTTFRPSTLGQAGRIAGITPADVTVVQIHLKKYSNEQFNC